MFLTSHDLQNFHKKVVTMKGVFKCIKFLTFSITLALCFVLFSEDTSALTLSLSIEPTGTSWGEQTVDCLYANDSSTWKQSTAGIGAWSCNRIDSTYPDIYGLRTHNTIHVEEGMYYQGFFILRNLNPNQLPQLYWNFNQSDDFNFITIEELYDDSIYTSLSYTCNTAGTSCTGTQHEDIFNKVYMVTLQATHTGDVRFQFGTPTSVLVKSVGTSNYVFGLRKIVEYKPSSIESALEEQNQKDDQDRSNMESQQSDSQQGADDSQSDAEQQGTTLLAAFTSFVNALTSATPSNCRLDMDLGNLDMGQVDLCQLSPPAGFSALASVFMILFCVPLSIATARKVISLFRSFQ